MSRATGASSPSWRSTDFPSPRAWSRWASRRPRSTTRSPTTTIRPPAPTSPVDSVAATDGFVTDIVAPLQEAQALFDGATYLTRLSTFISPPEMTKDPLFLFNGNLGDVSNLHVAQGFFECGDMQFDHCTARIRLALPDGTVERLQQSGAPYVCYGRGRLCRPTRSMPCRLWGSPGSGAPSVPASWLPTIPR